MSVLRPILISGLLLGGACGSLDGGNQAPPQAAIYCNSDVDCPTGNICQGNFCQTGSATCMGAGAACQPANACHTGVISCATGAAACTDTGHPDTTMNGKSCGSGQLCASGVCTASTAGAHLPFPQVTDHGGPVLDAPQLVTITFDGYRFRTDVEAYGDWIVASSWLTTVGADYGVGAGRHLHKIHLPASSLPSTSLTDMQLQTWLQSQLGKTVPAPGTGLPLYLIYLPTGTTVTQHSGQASCQAFLGYHGEAVKGTQSLLYAALPDCAGPPGQTDLQGLEITVSHEIIEAATDPQHATQTYTILDAQSPWSTVPGEVGDLCIGASMYADGSYVAQRIWSNAAAAAGGDPCIPVSGAPYANASPRSDGFLLAEAGASVSLTLTGWETAPTGSWALAAQPAFTSGFTAGFALDKTSLKAGETVTATFTIPAGTPSGYCSAFLVTSSFDSFQTYGLWPVGVCVP